MDTMDTFSETLFAAAETKQNWYDSSELITVLDEYRSFHSVVKNLINMLEIKGLIQPDPYKLEKKISDLCVPAETNFYDNEKSMVIGTRLSDYESQLDFICNFFKFSIDNLSLDKIKTLLALNGYILWNSLLSTSQRPNTRGLADIVVPIRMGSDQLSISMLNDCISQADKTLGKINSHLKDITEFQKELYKIEIRKKILLSSAFKSNDDSTLTGAMTQIKKLFPSAMGRKPFYAELIDEVIAEDYSPKKNELREKLLAKFSISESKKEKKKVLIDTKDMLMTAVRSLGATAPLLEEIITKIDENQKILASEQHGFMEKLAELFRKAFNKNTKPIEYSLTVIEPLTQSKKSETIIYQDFISDLSRRAKTYSSFSLKNTPGYQRIEGQTEAAIQEYLVKQLSECQKIITLLIALDDYFKTSIQPINRTRIKGLKMDLTSFKNTLVKTNQRKAEYTALVEEEAQLKKLGINNV